MKLKYGFKLDDIVIVLEKRFYDHGSSGFQLILKGTGDLLYKSIRSRSQGIQKRIAPRIVFNLFVYAEKAGFFEMKKKYYPMEIAIFNGEVYEIQPIYSYDPGPSQNTVIRISTGNNSKRVANHDKFNKRFAAFEKELLKVAGIKNMFPGPL